MLTFKVIVTNLKCLFINCNWSIKTGSQADRFFNFSGEFNFKKSPEIT